MFKPIPLWPRYPTTQKQMAPMLLPALRLAPRRSPASRPVLASALSLAQLCRRNLSFDHLAICDIPRKLLQAIAQKRLAADYFEQRGNCYANATARPSQGSYRSRCHRSP
jgi:hypothetical protein